MANNLPDVMFLSAKTPSETELTNLSHPLMQKPFRRELP